MPTQAENAINRATIEETGDDGKATGARKLVKPNISSKGERAQFRVTPTEGGYFMEEALGGGRFWLPRAYAITEGGDGIGADDIPAHVWEARQERAKRMARALATMREADLDPAKEPLNYDEIDAQAYDEKVHEAVSTYRSMRWILVWPAEVVAEHIAAYESQWTPAEAREEG